MGITAKRIIEVFNNCVDIDTAKEIAAITRQPYDFDNLKRIDELLETFGVEFIKHPKKYSYSNPAGLEYCNSGDTYSPTIGYDTNKGKWYIGTWGDWYENNGGLD